MARDSQVSVVSLSRRPGLRTHVLFAVIQGGSVSCAHLIGTALCPRKTSGLGIRKLLEMPELIGFLDGEIPQPHAPECGEFATADGPTNALDDVMTVSLDGHWRGSGSSCRMRGSVTSDTWLSLVQYRPHRRPLAHPRFVGIRTRCRTFLGSLGNPRELAPHLQAMGRRRSDCGACRSAVGKARARHGGANWPSTRAATSCDETGRSLHRADRSRWRQRKTVYRGKTKLTLSLTCQSGESVGLMTLR